MLTSMCVLQIEQLVKTAVELLSRHLKEPFCLSLLNLGATNFNEESGGAAASSFGAMHRFLSSAGAAQSSEPPITAGSQKVSSTPNSLAKGNRQQPSAAAQNDSRVHSPGTYHSKAAAQQQGGGVLYSERQHHQSVEPHTGGLERQESWLPKLVAEASTYSRRDYRGVDETKLMSKGQERRLKEGAAGFSAAAKPPRSTPVAADSMDWTEEEDEAGDETFGGTAGKTTSSLNSKPQQPQEISTSTALESSAAATSSAAPKAASAMPCVPSSSWGHPSFSQLGVLGYDIIDVYSDVDESGDSGGSQQSDWEADVSQSAAADPPASIDQSRTFKPCDGKLSSMSEADMGRTAGLQPRNDNETSHTTPAAAFHPSPAMTPQRTGSKKRPRDARPGSNFSNRACSMTDHVDRVVLHVDVDAFYCQVRTLLLKKG